MNDLSYHGIFNGDAIASQHHCYIFGASITAVAKRLAAVSLESLLNRTVHDCQKRIRGNEAWFWHGIRLTISIVRMESSKMKAVPRCSGIFESMGKGFANTTPLFLEDERESKATRPNDTRDGSESLYADCKYAFKFGFISNIFPGGKARKNEFFEGTLLLIED